MITNSTTNPSETPPDKKASLPGSATELSEPTGHTHEGKVLSVTGNQVVMSGKNGKECSHTVAADAKVTCDDIVCRTEDLKAGMRIRLTAKPTDKSQAIKIESLKMHADFGTC